MATKSKTVTLDRTTSRDDVLELLSVGKGELEKIAGCRIIIGNTLGTGAVTLSVKLCRKKHLKTDSGTIIFTNPLRELSNKVIKSTLQYKNVVLPRLQEEWEEWKAANAAYAVKRESFIKNHEAWRIATDAWDTAHAANQAADEGAAWRATNPKPIKPIAPIEPADVPEPDKFIASEAFQG